MSILNTRNKNEQSRGGIILTRDFFVLICIIYHNKYFEERKAVYTLIPHKYTAFSLCGITIYKISYKCYNKYNTLLN